ncbi:MAG: helix-turn-helix domain-containing protein [Sphaerochaeta sp.]
MENQNGTTNRKYVRIDAVAEFLNVKPRTIRSYVLNKRIPHLKQNGVLLFDLNEIDEWIQSGRVQAISRG